MVSIRNLYDYCAISYIKKTFNKEYRMAPRDAAIWFKIFRHIRKNCNNNFSVA